MSQIASSASVRPAGLAATAPRRRWWNTLSGREAIAFYLFLSPWIIGFIWFTVGPMIAAAVMVFHKYDILGTPFPGEYVGLDNVKRLLAGGDPLFWKSLRVTTVFTLFAVPANVIVGYVIALMLNQSIRGLSIWRTIYYLPAVVPIVATAVLWQWMLNSEFGVINYLLWLVGIRGPGWLGTEEWVLPSFALMTIWQAGGGLILYLAAMQGVPTTLYDAAKVDGANALQRLRHVTIPMTTFVIFFTTVTGFIGSFQIFAAGFVITNGKPNNASLFYVLYLYNVGWRYLQMGYAAVLAWVLFLLILILTILLLVTSTKWVHYEGAEKA
jgi:multiple sugar transport system permease protein